MKGRQGSGVVLASYGRGVLIQSDEIAMHCALKGRKQRVVCGDRIGWAALAPESGVTLESVEPRRNLIERIDARGRAEPVAANVDRLGLVLAPEPAPDWFLIDRYLAAARLKDIEALVIVNKSDLGLAALQTELATYRKLDLACVEISALNGEKIGALHRTLGAGETLLVGQSGVGKSSLINALVPDAAAQTAELTREAEGRHTTTTSRRYRLHSPADGAIIDAPGVRDFAPPASMMRAAELGFVEIHRLAGDCRFNDCRHFEEPGCAVRSAVREERVAARRYESYRRLHRLYEKLAP